ncbi:YjbE family putative metal transport protein [Asticcacaulis solisilvae]|uniref:YjbE family putative metal transport protein n=1 Tax=Asticcacaulis solisilvae TaxID=1217274 RepID=UPI003FD72BAE
MGPALAFLQVVFIDIVMAGDNAVAVGIAAAGLPADRRKKAIMYGLIGAVITRIGFVLITVQLLKVVGLLLAGGLLLLWVCWKMWRDMRKPVEPDHPDAVNRTGRRRSLASAVVSILVADVSMSLDNVLAVTGAAENHVWVLAFGLLFSIAAMGAAAHVIANVLHRYHWIGYIGVLVVLGVACKMIWEGGSEVWEVGHCDTTLKCLPELGSRFVSWVKGLAQLVSQYSHA